MPTFTPQEIWNLNTADLQKLLDTETLKPCANTVRFYAPSFTYYKTQNYCSQKKEFATISVTGNACSVSCRHCGGKVLETMHPAPTPETLFDLGVKLKVQGAKGVLVSGGCRPDGSVPLTDFIPVLRRFKQELGLTVFVHTGIIDTPTAQALKTADIDAALIDIIGSNQTIKQTLNLDITTQDYAESLRVLAKAEINIVPHVIVGLNGGRLDGEYSALQIIAATCKPAAVVIIAFMPIHGTEMANTQSPTPLDIAKVAAAARTMYPTTPLMLGCMRPKGKSRAETDVYALKAGVDAIAFPSDKAVEYAKSRGYSIEFSSYCCAQLYRDFVK